MSASELPQRPQRPSSEFLTDVEALRAQARRNLDQGAVTSAYGADLDQVMSTLQQALATEVICTLRYRQHHYAARGMNADPIAAEFLQHSQEEFDHAGRIAARISQLGGTPDFNPSTMAERSHSEYVEAASLRDMVVENLVAERIAVSAYTSIVEWLGSGDPTTRRMFEEILAMEEEHAEDLVSLLDGLPGPS